MSSSSSSSSSSAWNWDTFQAAADHSWVKNLNADPDASSFAPNKESREVLSGHYVPVLPTPLPNPKLLLYSRRMAKELELTEEMCNSPTFTSFFSGNIESLKSMTSWATPYALSIMGQPHINNCPFKTGNGYGDGRAVSMGEVVGSSGHRWEMQLKGGGTTPFCRGGDGRAVLRSSIREFLASEAMDALGISTTRALSLVVSESETVKRPWYSGATTGGPQREIPDLDDPRIAHLPIAVRQMLIAQLSEPDREPNTMIREKAAITTRVATSFTRVGHLDLFARRARKPQATQLQKDEHAKLIQHSLDREYPDLAPNSSLKARARMLIPVVAQRFADLAAGWIRVGFCQGNFNADNCLIGGRTMDYGPFGFIDNYDPKFAKWTGSGDHFAFMNQHNAAFANFSTFVNSLDPLFSGAEAEALRVQVRELQPVFDTAVNKVWRAKMGLPNTDTALQTAETLFTELEMLMKRTNTDYTIAWRQLMHVLPVVAGAEKQNGRKPSNEDLFSPLQAAFYKQPDESLKSAWCEWLRKWSNAVLNETQTSVDVAAAQMKAANPKYVPREWMLVAAYTAAGAGQYELLNELHNLFEHPYDEQPQMESKYYRRAPDESLTQSGTAFMT